MKLTVSFNNTYMEHHLKFINGKFAGNKKKSSDNSSITFNQTVEIIALMDIASVQNSYGFKKRLVKVKEQKAI